MRRALLLSSVLIMACDPAASEPVSDAKIEFKTLEDSIPVTDTGVKYEVTVKGSKGPVITAITSTLTAVYTVDGSEKSDLLATETDDGSSWSAEDNPFPGAVGSDWEGCGGMVFMEDDKSAKLQKLYAERESNKLKLMLGVELKSTGGKIAPLKQEIKLLPPKP